MSATKLQPCCRNPVGQQTNRIIDLCGAGLVCRQWRRVSADEDLWRSLNFGNKNIFIEYRSMYPNATVVSCVRGRQFIHSKLSSPNRRTKTCLECLCFKVNRSSPFNVICLIRCLLQISGIKVGVITNFSGTNECGIDDSVVGGLPSSKNVIK